MNLRDELSSQFRSNIMFNEKRYRLRGPELQIHNYPTKKRNRSKSPSQHAVLVYMPTAIQSKSAERHNFYSELANRKRLGMNRNMGLKTSSLNHLENAETASYIFSAFSITPLAIILSGQLLAKVFPIEVSSPLNFNLSINGKNLTLKAGASGSEVLLGFVFFLITLFFCGILAGKRIHEIMVYQFGLACGHTIALCMFSSLLSLLISAIIFFIANKTSLKISPLPSDLETKRQEALAKIAGNQKSRENNQNDRHD